MWAKDVWGKDRMEKFCEFLREHAMKSINFEKKKKEFINKNSSKNHRKTQKSVIFVKTNLKINF